MQNIVSKTSSCGHTKHPCGTKAGDVKAWHVCSSSAMERRKQRSHTHSRNQSPRFRVRRLYRYHSWRLLCKREHVETLDDGVHRDSSHHEQCVGLRQEDPRHRENASRKSARMNWRSQEFGVVINRSGRGAEVPNGEQKP